MTQSRQKTVFSTGEGDAWYERNKEAMHNKNAADDPVLEALRILALSPQTVLEIGCSNGWRLREMQAVLAGAACHGIDPSAQAIAEGQEAAPSLRLQVGTAEKLAFPDEQFNLVVFGFCLYLCDRTDLFRIAAEADRVLAENGYLILYDFCTDTPYRNAYTHRPGYYSYKMHYPSLFTWNPAYTTLYHRIISHAPDKAAARQDDRVGITVLRKSYQEAYPDNPYK
jgi:ubiquinone/menaquinone biosynthesis C-methylase UbiE